MAHGLPGPFPRAGKKSSAKVWKNLGTGPWLTLGIAAPLELT